MVEHFLKQIMLRKISFKGQKLSTVGLNQYSLLLSVVNKYSNKEIYQWKFVGLFPLYCLIHLTKLQGSVEQLEEKITNEIL